MKKTLLLLLLGTCACAGAKTVALWTLNMDAERGLRSGRSLVSYHTLAATATSTGIGTRPNGVGIPANVEVPEGLAAADFADDGRTWSIGEGLPDAQSRPGDDEQLDHRGLVPSEDASEERQLDSALPHAQQCDGLALHHSPALGGNL